MTNPCLDVESSWRDVQTMTTALLAAAENKDWGQVIELAALRHQNLLEHFRLFPVGPATSDYYRQRIGDILQGEELLQAQILEARKKVMQMAWSSNRNHRAVGAYLDTAVR